MSNSTTIFNYSVGRKLIMGLTGLFLCIFLLEHLYTNLLLYKCDGGEAFNEASHSMVHNILIRTVEIFLFAAIILHVYQAFQITQRNSAARPVKYAVPQSSETSTWFSRNMGLTGSFILFFIVIHLYNFFLPYRILHSIGNEGQQTVAENVIEAFHNPIYALIYFVSIVILGLHLNHGFQSAFQTFGLSNKHYSPILKKVGSAFALLVIIGFGSFPVVYFFNLLGN